MLCEETPTHQNWIMNAPRTTSQPKPPSGYSNGAGVFASRAVLSFSSQSKPTSLSGGLVANMVGVTDSVVVGVGEDEVISTFDSSISSFILFYVDMNISMCVCLVCLSCVCVCRGYVYGLMGARGDGDCTNRKLMVDDSMVLVKKTGVVFILSKSQRENENRIECRCQSESFLFLFPCPCINITMGSI